MPKKAQERGRARVALARFHDCAALSILYPKDSKDRGTVYIDAKGARALARDFARLARSLESVKFTAHDFRSEGAPAFESSAESAKAAPVNRARRIRVYEYTAPASWASALINGDDSGLEDSDARACAAWAKTLPGPIVSCSSEHDGPGFLTWHDARDVAPYAADCLTYTVHATKKG